MGMAGLMQGRREWLDVTVRRPRTGRKVRGHLVSGGQVEEDTEDAWGKRTCGCRDGQEAEEQQTKLTSVQQLKSHMLFSGVCGDQNS